MLKNSILISQMGKMGKATYDVIPKYFNFSNFNAELNQSYTN